jgi:hypothetical protein
MRCIHGLLLSLHPLVRPTLDESAIAAMPQVADTQRKERFNKARWAITRTSA